MSHKRSLSTYQTGQPQGFLVKDNYNQVTFFRHYDNGDNLDNSYFTNSPKRSHINGGQTIFNSTLHNPFQKIKTAAYPKFLTKRIQKLSDDISQSIKINQQQQISYNMNQTQRDLSEVETLVKISMGQERVRRMLQTFSKNNNMQQQAQKIQQGYMNKKLEKSKIKKEIELLKVPQLDKLNTVITNADQNLSNDAKQRLKERIKNFHQQIYGKQWRELSSVYHQEKKQNASDKKQNQNKINSTTKQLSNQIKFDKKIPFESIEYGSISLMPK